MVKGAVVSEWLRRGDSGLSEFGHIKLQKDKVAAICVYLRTTVVLSFQAY
jgi:hypothetical protein